MTVLFICEPKLLRFYEKRAIKVLNSTYNTAIIIRDGTEPKIPMDGSFSAALDGEFECTTQMLADELGISQRAIQNRILRLRLKCQRAGKTFILTRSQAELVRNYSAKKV